MDAARKSRSTPPKRPAALAAGPVFPLDVDGPARRSRPAWPGTLRPEILLSLQRSAGNAAVQHVVLRASQESTATNASISVRMFRAGLARALRAHGEHVTGEQLNVTAHADELMKFSLRVSREGRALPSMEQVLRKKPRPGSVPGAVFMLLGALQQLGDRVRITMRVVAVETSEIVAAGLGDAQGSGASAVAAAAGLALKQLGPLDKIAEQETSTPNG